MPETLRAGIVGVGHLGRIHLEQWRHIKGVEIAGFFDTDESVADSISQSTGLQCFESATALFDAVDVVDIVSPTPSHYQYGMECLDRGKPVFVEKPLAATTAEAEHLAGLSGEKKVLVQVGHVERFNPAFRAALPYLGTPMFIEAHRLAQFNPRGTDVSVIFDLMIHDLDIVLSINPTPVRHIMASGVAVVSDSPDIANARIEFENGCVANLTASRMSVKNMRKARFFQQQAYISVDFLAKKAEVIRLKPLAGEPDPLSLVMDTGSRGKQVIYFENPEIRDTNAIRSELEQFVVCVRDGGRPSVTARDGARAVRVAQEISEKIKTSPVPIGQAL